VSGSAHERARKGAATQHKCALCCLSADRCHFRCRHCCTESHSRAETDGRRWTCAEPLTRRHTPSAFKGIGAEWRRAVHVPTASLDELRRGRFVVPGVNVLVTSTALWGTSDRKAQDVLCGRHHDGLRCLNININISTSAFHVEFIGRGWIETAARAASSVALLGAISHCNHWVCTATYRRSVPRPSRPRFDGFLARWCGGPSLGKPPLIFAPHPAS